METYDPFDIDDFLGNVTHLLKAKGNARAVAVILDARGQWDLMEVDAWNGGTNRWQLLLEVDLHLVDLLSEVEREKVEGQVEEVGRELFRRLSHDSLNDVSIVHDVGTRPNWREDDRAWLAGSAINNQGRVRSDNVASIQEDGLLFRSPPEVRLYKALKARGVTFAPLPVFVRGGRNYRRLEPDFLIIKDGIVYQVEVDGDTVHRESPADAQKRTAPMAYEGVEILRIASSDIRDDDEAARRVDAILKWIDKTKQNRR